MVMNIKAPKNIEKFLNRCATSGLSRRSQLHGVKGKKKKVKLSL
jgi:hypothetical protein